MPQLVGREPEHRHRPRACAFRQAIVRVEGEPGIGMSELVRASVERARSLGFEVLHGRPSAAEARLAFASLSDLLEPIVDRSVHELPEPRVLRRLPRPARTSTAPSHRRIAAGSAGSG
jgi:hypothetical protein